MCCCEWRRGPAAPGIVQWCCKWMTGAAEQRWDETSDSHPPPDQLLRPPPRLVMPRASGSRYILSSFFFSSFVCVHPMMRCFFSYQHWNIRGSYITKCYDLLSRWCGAIILTERLHRFFFDIRQILIYPGFQQSRLTSVISSDLQKKKKKSMISPVSSLLLLNFSFMLKVATLLDLPQGGMREQNRHLSGSGSGTRLGKEPVPSVMSQGKDFCMCEVWLPEGWRAF